MSYIDESVGSGEQLVYRAKFPTVRYVGAWALVAAFALMASVAFGREAYASGATLVVLGAAAFSYVMLPVWSIEVGVTSKRVIFKTGLLQRVTQELQLNSIEVVKLNQDVAGRIFNYGQLSIHGTGAEVITLPSLANPVEIQRAIQNGRDIGKKDDAPTGPPVAPHHDFAA